MWLADPAYTERAPDGPGSAGSLAGWWGAGSPDGGYYGVILTGAQFDDGTVGVDDGSPRGSSRVTLETHPNPSRVAVTISYSIPQAGAVRLRILDMQGRLVRTSLDGSRAEPANSLQWDGRAPGGGPAAEGGWKLSVTAVDDRAVRSTAERQFELNDTLGGLQATPPAARLRVGAHGVVAATFELAHPARVRVTVEKRSGIVVATLLDKPLRPGAQKVPWNGRTWTGALAFTGAYQLHVVATNTVGKVSLVAPFVARRS